MEGPAFRPRKWLSVRVAASTFLLFSALLAKAQQSPKPPSLPPVTPAQPESHFLIVLDPAHGGPDNGAMLAPGSPEKNYTLSLAIRLHVLLNASGIPSIFTRDSDTTVDSDARAEAANRAHAAACILLHAASTGNGVHLFTSSLAVAGQKPSQAPDRTFLPWQTVQASFGTESLGLESDINTALANRQIPVVLERTSLMPLDSMACPAVVVEVAPLNVAVPLSDMSYQEKIAQALASGLIAWRHDWKLQP